MLVPPEIRPTLDTYMRRHARIVVVAGGKYAGMLSSLSYTTVRTGGAFRGAIDRQA